MWLIQDAFFAAGDERVFLAVWAIEPCVIVVDFFR
jgi:hypothetical protein